MSSKKQSQWCPDCMEKSFGKGKKPNQPLSNDECCNANPKLDAPNNQLISKKNKPTRKFWLMVRLFANHAKRDDLIWLDNLIKDFKDNGDEDVVDRPVDLNKDNEDEYLAKQLLRIKMNIIQNETETTVLNPSIQPYILRFVFRDADGEQLVISRETLQSHLTKNHVKPVPKANFTKCKLLILSNEFITRLIYWDDTLSHLRGIPSKQIDDYVNKCLEEDCLKNIKIKMEKMDKKISGYKKRANYSLKKERKTALMYRECEDIRLILEKYNDYVSGKQRPYFMFH